MVGFLALEQVVEEICRSFRKEILFEEEPLNNEFKEVAFGFKTLKGFEMKIRGDGYIVADNQLWGLFSN